MNTKLLSINGIDYSDYITEKDMSVKYIPVYDESSEFVAMDKTEQKTLLGYRAVISVDFPYLDETAAKNLSAVLSGEKCSVTYLFPDEKTADFREASLTLEPVREVGEEKIWSAFLSMRSEIMRLDCL